MTRGIEWPNAYLRDRTTVVEFGPEQNVAILSEEALDRLIGYLERCRHTLKKIEG